MAKQYQIIINVDGDSYRELSENAGVNVELLASYLKNDAEYGIDKQDFHAFAERVMKGEEAEIVINPLRR